MPERAARQGARLLMLSVILSLGTFAAFGQGDGMQEIWQPTEEGWFDIDLGVTAVAADGDHLVVTGEGMFRGEKVGLKVAFRKDMKPGIVNAGVDQSAFAQGGIEFVSIGEESDQLLTAMATLYGLPPQERRFAKSLAVLSLPLEEKPIDFDRRYIHLKVFFNPKDGPDRYAELFVNLNLPEKRLELHEKDAEYRHNVVAALSGPHP